MNKKKKTKLETTKSSEKKEGDQASALEMSKMKSRKRQHSVETAELANVSASPAVAGCTSATEQSSTKKKKRDDELTDEEKARREMQRQRQQAAKDVRLLFVRRKSIIVGSEFAGGCKWCRI